MSRIPLRRWNALDRELPVLGLGCWQLGGTTPGASKANSWGAMTAEHAAAIVHAALEGGIRFFDTAAGYGRSEEFLGQALATTTLGKEAVVCTKVPLAPDGQLNDLPQQVEAALQRLQRNHLDILLLHGPPDDLDWHNYDRSALDALVRAGKVLAYGVSSRSLKGARNVVDARFGSVVEWVYNMLERRPESELFPAMHAAGMDFIARSPLNRGLLSTRGHSAAWEYPSTDFRSTIPAELIAWARASVDRLELPPATLAQLATYALRFSIALPNVQAVIPGTTDLRNLHELLRAAEAPALPSEDLARISALIEPCYPPWA